MNSAGQTNVLVFAPPTYIHLVTPETKPSYSSRQVHIGRPDSATQLQQASPPSPQRTHSSLELRDKQ